MSEYSVTGKRALAGAGNTILYFVNGASAPRKLKLRRVVASFQEPTAPSDHQTVLAVKRITDESGTPGGNPVTPNPLIEGEAAATANAFEAPTGEPTYQSVEILRFALHHRATYDSGPLEGIDCDALEDHGFGVVPESATDTTRTPVVTMHFGE